MDPKLFSTRHAILLLCAAILTGATLQALATWVGLRAINSTLSSVASAACREAHAAPSGSTASLTPPASSPPLPSVVDEQRTERDAQLDLRDRLINAFLAQKPAYAKGCFANRVGVPRRYAIEIEIDAAGQETRRVLRSGEGEEPQPELDACVRDLKLPPLRIKPPGKAATGVIETRLP